MEAAIYRLRAKSRVAAKADFDRETANGSSVPQTVSRATPDFALAANGRFDGRTEAEEIGGQRQLGAGSSLWPVHVAHSWSVNVGADDESRHRARKCAE